MMNNYIIHLLLLLSKYYYLFRSSPIPYPYLTLYSLLPKDETMHDWWIPSDVDMIKMINIAAKLKRRGRGARVRKWIALRTQHRHRPHSSSSPPPYGNVDEWEAKQCTNPFRCRRTKYYAKLKRRQGARVRHWHCAPALSIGIGTNRSHPHHRRQSF